MWNFAHSQGEKVKMLDEAIFPGMFCSACYFPQMTSSTGGFYLLQYTLGDIPWNQHCANSNCVFIVFTATTSDFKNIMRQVLQSDHRCYSLA